MIKIFLNFTAFLALTAITPTTFALDHEEMKSSYNDKLDYEQEGGFNSMIRFESILLKKSTWIMSKTKALTQNDTEWLTYSALFIVNTNTAIEEGLLSATEIPAENRFTTETDKKLILKARTETVDKYLKRAEMYSEDGRIKYWAENAKIHADLFSDLSPTNEEVKHFAEISKQNVFSFLNGYIGSTQMGYSFTEFDNAFSETADRWINSKLTCKIDGKGSCFSSLYTTRKHSPHGVEGGFLILGDYFIRRFETTPIEQADHRETYLKKALKAWKDARSLPILAGKNPHNWSLYPAIVNRIRTYKKAKANEVFKEGLDWKAAEQKKVFHCSSCHTQ